MITRNIQHTERRDPVESERSYIAPGYIADIEFLDFNSFCIVQDGIYNSVADYNSSSVGVGCRMLYVPCFLFFLEGITFERFKLEG